VIDLVKPLCELRPKVGEVPKTPHEQEAVLGEAHQALDGALLISGAGARWHHHRALPAMPDGSHTPSRAGSGAQLHGYDTILVTPRGWPGGTPLSPRITYEVESGGTIEERELPFMIGVMADLSGDRDPLVDLPPLKERTFIEIDRDNFDDVLRRAAPHVALDKIPDYLTPAGDVPAPGMLGGAIRLQSLEDFNPPNIVKQVAPLDHLNDQRAALLALQSCDAAHAQSLGLLMAELARPTGEWTDAHAALVCAALPAGTTSEGAQRVMAAIQAHIPNLLHDAAPHGMAEIVDLAVARIDQRMNHQLSTIMHADAFRALEATWLLPRRLFDGVVTRQDDGHCLAPRSAATVMTIATARPHQRAMAMAT